MSFFVGSPSSARRDAFRSRDQPSLQDKSPEQLREDIRQLRKELVDFENRYQKSRADNKKLIQQLAVYNQKHDADRAEIKELLEYKTKYDLVEPTIKELEKARDDEHIRLLQTLVLLQETEAKLEQAQQHITELPSLRSHSVDTAASLKETEGKLADANNSLQQTQDTLTATQQQVIEFQQQNKDLQQQMGAEKQQHEKVQQGLKDLQRQHTELQQQQRDAEAAAAAAAEEAAALQEQVAELEGKLQKLTAAKAELQAVVEELQEAAASAEAAKQEVQQLQEQAQRDAVQIAEMEHLCDTLQQDMNTAKANLAESARQRGLLQQQIQAAESARLELQQQLDEAKRDNHAREIESRQQQAELLGDVHQLQASFATLSNQLQAAGQQAGQEALSTLGAPADEAAAERIALLERELAAAKQQNDRLSADLADARDEAHLAAVAVSEHKTMLASVQEELTVAQQQLMSAQQGSMTAVLRAADNHRRAGLSRLADTEQQETQTALQEMNEELQLQVATLQQELTSVRESLFEEVKKAENIDSQAGEQASRIVHMQTQLAVQQAAVQEKQQLLDLAVDGQNKLQEDLQQLQADFDDLTEDRRQLLDQLETLQLQVNVGRNQVLEAQQLAARSTAETSLARREVGAALRDVALVRTELGSLRSTLTALSAELTAEESGLSAIELEADRLRIQLKNAAADAATGDDREVERSMFEYYSGRADDIMKQLQAAKKQQYTNRNTTNAAAERVARNVAYLEDVSRRLANLTNEVSTADNSRASSMPGVITDDALNHHSLQHQLLQHQLLQRLPREDDEVQSAAAATTSAAAGPVPPLAHLQAARPSSVASGTSHQPGMAAAAAAAVAGADGRDLPATPASTPAHSMMGSSGTPYQTPWPATALAAAAAAIDSMQSPLDVATADVASFPVAAIEAAAEQAQASPTPAAAAASVTAANASGSSEPSWRLHPAFSPARSASVPSSAAETSQQQPLNPAALDQLVTLLNRAGEHYDTSEDFQVAIEAVTGAFAVQDQQQLLQQAMGGDNGAAAQPVATDVEHMQEQHEESDAQGSISLERGMLQQQQQSGQAFEEKCSSVASVAGGGSTVAGFIQEEQCEDEGEDNVMFRRFLEGASTIGSTAGSVHSVKSAASGSSSAAMAAAAPADALQQQQQLMQQHAMATIAAAPRVGGVQLDVMGESSGVSNQVTAGRGVVNPSLDDSPPTPHFWRHPAVVSSASQRSPGSVSSTSGPAQEVTPSRSTSHLRSQSEPATPESVLRAVAQGLADDQAATASQASPGDFEKLDLGSFSSPLMFQMSPVGNTPHPQQQQPLPATAAAAAAGSSGSPGSISLGSLANKAGLDSPGSSTLSGISFGAGSPSPGKSPQRDIPKAHGSSSRSAEAAAAARARPVPKLQLNLVQTSMSNGSAAGASSVSGSFSGFHGGSSVGDVIPIPEVPTGESDTDEASSAEVSQRQQQRWPLHEADHGGDGFMRGSFAGFAGDVSVGAVIPIPPVPLDMEVGIGGTSLTTGSSSSSSAAGGGRPKAQKQFKQTRFKQVESPVKAVSSESTASGAAGGVSTPAAVADASSSQAAAPAVTAADAAAAVTPEVPRLTAGPEQHQQQQIGFSAGVTPGPEAYFTAQLKAPWMNDADGSTAAAAAAVSPVAFGGFAVADTAAAAAPEALQEEFAEDQLEQQQQRQQEFYTCVPDARTRTVAATVEAEAAEPKEYVAESAEGDINEYVAESSDVQQQQALEQEFDAASEVGSSPGAFGDGADMHNVTADDDDDEGSVSGEPLAQQQEAEDEIPAVANDSTGIEAPADGSNTACEPATAATVGPPEPEGPSAIKHLVKRLDFDDENLASSDHEQ